MRVFAQGKLLASSKMSFTSDKGEYVEYFENAFKGEGGIISMNSKADFSGCEGMEGVVEIEAKELDSGKGFKLTLKNFHAGKTLPEDDEEIT